MSASDSQTPTLRGYVVRRSPPSHAPQRELGPYERSYELRRGYEASAPGRDTDRERADAPARGR